jgi:phosphate-selective porin OprO/OprP
MGAIELTARYSELDLSDEAVNAGRLDTTTLGVNWYLNPNTRVMLNYVLKQIYLILVIPGMETPTF